MLGRSTKLQKNMLFLHLSEGTYSLTRFCKHQKMIKSTGQPAGCVKSSVAS